MINFTSNYVKLTRY